MRSKCRMNQITQWAVKESKMKISVDHPQQNIEKNMDWRDFPCMNVESGRKLTSGLGHYFKTWEEYCKEGNDTNYDTK